MRNIFFVILCCAVQWTAAQNAQLGDTSTFSNEKMEAEAFPIPFSDYLQINLGKSFLFKEGTSIALYDIRGRQVLTHGISADIHTVKLSTKELDQGFYFVRYSGWENQSALNIRVSKH